MTSLSITEARERLGSLASQTLFKGERITIHRHGKPVAVLVSAEDAELLEKLEDILDLEEARKALKEPGLVSWKKVKEDLGL